MSDMILDLLFNIQEEPNQISSTAYDTAWLAWLNPEARQWLVEAQHPDGSWGADLEYYHDRVISTLSAINAIAATSTNKYDLAKIERGIAYLKKAIPQISCDIYETVGFELLLPSLVTISESLGLHVQEIKAITRLNDVMYRQKLRLIPTDTIYSPDVVVAHSLEFIGFNDLDYSAVANLRTTNGSIHDSPSATAFVEVALGGSEGGKTYLDNLLKKYNNTAPGFFPFDFYEIIWVLYHVSLAYDLKSLRPTIDPFLHRLRSAWHENGIGFSPTFVSDPDNTALMLRIFNELDLYCDFSALQSYELDDHFQCFPLERDVSMDVHIHIITALENATGFERRDDLLSKAINTLRRHWTLDYIFDKWHVSPYYSTSHAVIALTGVADDIVGRPIRWLLKTQREDGSWTFYPNCPGAAIEETAYTLMALMTVYERNGMIPLEVIDKGIRYLESHYQGAKGLPGLWIHKALYTPYHIVDAVILSTLTKYHYLNHAATSIKISVPTSVML